MRIFEQLDYKKMLKLKSAIATDGKLREFVRKAVEAYKPQLKQYGGPCCTGFRVPSKLNISVLVPNTCDRVNLKNVPVYKCPKCGDISVPPDIERAIEDILEHFQEKGVPTPPVIDIEDVLKRGGVAYEA